MLLDKNENFNENSNENDNENYESWVKDFFSFIGVILIALLIRVFIFEPFYVPTGSMKQTLLEGDYVFATKYDYGFSKHSVPFSPNLFEGRFWGKKPAQGDVIIFKMPKMTYVKRLIGLPGDRISFKDNNVFINDIPLKRQYLGELKDKKGIVYNKYKEFLPNNKGYEVYYKKDKNPNFPKEKDIYIVPEKHFFFMGDNRDDSNDSRFELGYIGEGHLIAKVKWIFFSTEEELILDDFLSFKQIAQIPKWICSIRFKRLMSPIN